MPLSPNLELLTAVLGEWLKRALWLNLNGFYTESIALFGDWSGQDQPGLNILITPDVVSDLSYLVRKCDKTVEKYVDGLLRENTKKSFANFIK